MSATPARASAIVTGAGSGIGRAVARALLVDGFGVTLAGRRSAPLHETAAFGDEPAAQHPDAHIVETDVTDAAQVNDLVARHVARFGRLDVFVNNAGVFGPTADVGDLDPADWDATLAVNLTGAVLCAGAAFRQMRSQSPIGGRIIDNGSISAQTPRPLSVAYTTTKHAIAGLTKSIELDGRAHRITATQLDIGNARTELIGALVGDGPCRPTARAFSSRPWTCSTSPTWSCTSLGCPSTSACRSSPSPPRACRSSAAADPTVAPLALSNRANGSCRASGSTICAIRKHRRAPASSIQEGTGARIGRADEGYPTSIVSIGPRTK
ncbi:putative oxidoreductase [Microbacterium sp. SA39]|nr:putative oxidoreductase [Microbacterium sp. SA39]